MFLRGTNRKKDGKDHRYFSVVENRRLSSGKTARRTVLYLGEVNDKQESSWRKTLEVFDENRQRSSNLSLFPEDREIPADAVDPKSGGWNSVCLAKSLIWLEISIAAHFTTLVKTAFAVTACRSGGYLDGTVPTAGFRINRRMASAITAVID